MANPTAYTQPHRIVEQSGLALRVDQIQDSAGAVVGGATQQATIADLSVTDGVSTFAGFTVVKTRVTVGTNDVAVETAIATVPINAIILAVMADVVTAFDGATTQTFEVGLTGNIDKYIDTADFLPETATESITNAESTTADQNTIEATGDSTMAIVSTHTNNAGTVGAVDVTVVYLDTLTGQFELATQTAASFAEVETKVNAILVALEDAGIVADA